MKSLNTRSLITAAALAAACAPGVSSAEGDWYISAFVQQTDLDTVNTVSTEPVAGVSRNLGLDTDEDTGFGVTFGRTVFKQQNGNSISVELSYNNTDFDPENIIFMGNDFLTSEGASEGSFETETILARAVYRFDLGKVNPYLGIGIGSTDFEADGRYGGSVGSASQSQPPFVTGSDSATAIEFRAGVEYSFTEAFGVFLEYTTTDVDDIRLTRVGGGPGGLATTDQEGDLSFDSINLGARFRF